MKTLVAATAALSLLLVSVAEAKPGNGRGNGHGARGGEGLCPPGLAKRNPACIPPGQVGRRGRDEDDGQREERPQRDAEADREEEREREARAEPPEPDPVTILLGLIDDIPVRDAPPSDAATLDLPSEPAPRTVPQPVVLSAADPQPTAVDTIEEPQAPVEVRPEEPATTAETEIGQVFRRARADGSTGY